MSFEPNGVNVTEDSREELDRVVRMVKSNPGYIFEVQVLLAGYEEDSVVSNPDLTEVVYDSINTTYTDIDSLGQLVERDTMVVKTRYHNDRTLQQAGQVVAYLVSKGTDPASTSIFGNARPEAIPENRKTTVSIFVKKKED